MVRQRVALPILLVWLLLVCNAPALASDSKEQIAERARQLLELSEVQNFKDHPLALQTARQALELSKSVGDIAATARALDQIGRCHFAQSDLAEATQNYQESLQLWRQQNNLRQQAEALIMLGFIEVNRGNWQNAFSYHTQAQALVNEKSDPGLMARIAAGLAGIFNENGSPQSALTQYQRALDFYRLSDDERGQQRMTMFLGYTHSLLGDPTSAETHLQEALAGFAHPLDGAQCREFLAQLKFSLGEYDAALRHLQPTLAIYERAPNPKRAAHVRALIGHIHAQQGDLPRARASYLEASQTFRRILDRVNDAAVSFALGQLELKSGNYDDAETYLKHSIENTESIRRTSTGRDLTTAFAASVHARYAAYIECLMRKHKSQPSHGLDVLAFEASELARARSLAQLLHDTQTNLLTGVDAQTAEQEKSLRQSIRAKEDYRIDLLATDYSKTQLDEVEASLSRLREEYKQVLDKIRAVNPAYDQISQPSAYSVRQIQQDVIEDDKTVLLEYFLGTEASYVWLVTKNGFTAHEIPKEARITDGVLRLVELLSVKPGADAESNFQYASQELGQMILGPVSTQLAGRRVIVVADRALNYVPFQVLSLTDNKLLVDESEVVNAPSASILGQLRQERSRRRPAEKIVAAFGDAVFPSNYDERRNSGSPQVTAQQGTRSTSRDIEIAGDSVKLEDIQPLFYARWELQNLRDLAGPAASLSMDFDASREKLESTRLGEYSILHLATHGVLDPAHPEKSGFLLSTVDRNGQPQNGFITMRDVYGLRAPVDLVVLSACQTALGKEVRGEGLIGLTRGFMHAGASSVVSTLWKVDDEATAELMKHFYVNMLQQGMTPAAALRAAQNTIRQDARWRSPHYWAAFTLQGEYKQTINVGTATAVLIQRIAIGTVLIAFLAGAAWWFLRRRAV